MCEFPQIHILDEVKLALEQRKPLVALESTVITHGLPFPVNVKLAQDMEDVIRRNGAVPATICVLDGVIQVGTNKDQLARLSSEEGLKKVSLRDFALTLQQKKSGGTTVAGTMFIASKMGIKVFATGGIGGVHRRESDAAVNSYDISTDLYALSNIPMIIVCAGAKAILDLPATLEIMETLGIPVIGYQTDEFPAFYSRSSGLKVPISVEKPREIVDLARYHWGLGLKSAVLVTVPPPKDVAIPIEVVDRAIEQAIKEAKANHIHGQKVTPFLLEKVNEHTQGKSMEANLGLLLNNAYIATLISKETNGQL